MLMCSTQALRGAAQAGTTVPQEPQVLRSLGCMLQRWTPLRQHAPDRMHNAPLPALLPPFWQRPSTGCESLKVHTRGLQSTAQADCQKCFIPQRKSYGC